MSEQDDISRNIERIAAELGIAGAKCRRMHREGFEDDGEWFPPYDEYEVRAGRKQICIDAESVSRARPMGDFIRMVLEGWWK